MKKFIETMRKNSLNYFIILGVLLYSLSFVTIPPANAQHKMTAGMGMGFTYPLGDMGDEIDWAVPVLGSVQYLVIPQVTIEADAYYYMYPVTDFDTYTIFQFGAGTRFWVDKAYRRTYLSAGYGRTTIKKEKTQNVQDDYTFEKEYNTLYLKLGYSVSTSYNGILDFGIRYDCFGFQDWADQPVTIYAMSMLTF